MTHAIQMVGPELVFQINSAASRIEEAAKDKLIADLSQEVITANKRREKMAEAFITEYEKVGDLATQVQSALEQARYWQQLFDAEQRDNDTLRIGARTASDLAARIAEREIENTELKRLLDDALRRIDELEVELRETKAERDFADSELAIYQRDADAPEHNFYPPDDPVRAEELRQARQDWERALAEHPTPSDAEAAFLKRNFPPKPGPPIEQAGEGLLQARMIEQSQYLETILYLARSFAEGRKFADAIAVIC